MTRDGNGISRQNQVAGSCGEGAASQRPPAPTINAMTDRPGRPDTVGGNRPALHRERAYELLADGEWHDYHRVLTATAAMVNPAQAYRHAIRYRKTPPPADPESRAKLVRTGQRSIARSALARPERFEQRVSAGGERQIRLKPWQIPTAEQRSAMVRKGIASRSPERRSEISKKGWERRRARESN